MSLLIQGADVVGVERGAGPSAGQRLDLRIRGERVAEIGKNLPVGDSRAVDASGCIAAPGLIDMHVHLRDPGQTHKETLKTGGRAAAAGGFTTVACMPNTEPALDSPALVEDLLKRAAESCLAEVLPVGAITLGLDGEEPAPYDALRESGCVAFSDDGKSCMREDLMRALLKKSARDGFPVLAHCEDPLISGEGAVHAGEAADALGVPGIPPSAEEAVIARDARLCLETGGRLHIQHVSTRTGAEIIRRAKAMGANLTAEACPHHFALTDKAVLTRGADAKMNPPLRTADDAEALIEGLADGTIDALATDHAPHAPDEKALGLRKAPFGVIGLEMCVPLVWTRLVHAGRLSAEAALEKLTTVPAAILGLPAPSLRVGGPADLTLINPSLELEVGESKIYSKSRNTPFMGERLRGWPVLTVRRGAVVFERSIT